MTEKDDTSEPGGRPDPAAIVTRQDFARELTSLRERAGLGVRDVARAVGIPTGTLGGYFSGRHLPALKPPTLLHDILRSCGVTDPAEISEWADALSRVRRAPGRRPASAPVPYRGLASFQPEDAEWFYGREKLTEATVARLTERPGGGLFMVVGPSGSGKSSLLRAGVIPAIRAGSSVAGSDRWPWMLFTPGARPIDDFARNLASMAGMPAEDVAGVTADLRGDPGGCRDLLRRALAVAAGAGSTDRNADPRALVVVDQFEQMFIECTDPEEQRMFITALQAAGVDTDRGDGESNGGSAGPAGTGAAPPALVVLGMRADFYAHAMRFPVLTTALQDFQIAVGAMSETELRRAVLEPARKAKIDCEEGLVELLLRDLSPASPDGTAAHDSGTLPLLSHALLSTWQRGSKNTLRIADYHEVGGIRGAIADTAEEVYSSFDSTYQGIARQIFLRLVHIDDGTADVRRRVRAAELLDDRAGSDIVEEVQAVLDGFIGRRLLTVDADTVEITHEALLHEWPRLRDWLNADRAGRQTHRELTIAASSWADLDRDSTTLHRGTRLAVAREWAADPRHRSYLNVLEREFLDASVQQEAEEQRVERRRTRRLYQMLAALSVLLVLAGALAGFSLQQRADAKNQRDQAISREVAIKANRIRDSDPALAAQLSLAAYRIAPTAQARASLLDSSATAPVTRMLGFPGVMQTAAVTGDGRLMAAAGADRTIRLWSLADVGRPVPLGEPLSGHTDTVFSVAFSPDGRTLASGGADRAVRLWDVTDPGRPLSLGPLADGGPTNTVYSVVFSPDGRTLAAGGADNVIRLWDVGASGRPAMLLTMLTGMDGYVQSVAFSPDGRILAAGSADRTVRLWDVADPRRPNPLGEPLAGPTGTVFSVAFSPDGHTLAAGSADRSVRIWDVGNPRAPVLSGPPLTGAAGWVNAVAFSPDGRFLVAGSSDTTVKIWDFASRRLVAVLHHPGPVTALTFLTDHRLATAAADGVARLWSVPGPVISSLADVINVGFTPDGRSLAVVSSNADNSLGLWDVGDRVRPSLHGPPVTGPPEPSRFTGSLAVGPDGRTVAVG
ncbi:nSTAND1 domain-containing NTPase, partial [Frankia sp. CiP1_Cm_nod2]